MTAARSTAEWADRAERRLPEPVRSVVHKSRGQDILLFASGLAFYALISVIPLTMVAIWVASLVAGEERIHAFARELQSLSPEGLDAGRLVQRVADQGTSLGLLSLIVALWPATAYGAGLRRAFDRLGPKKPKELKGLRGRALALVVLLPLFVLGSLIGSFAGTTILDDNGWQRVVGIGLAIIFGFAGTAGGVALIYRIFPPERLPTRAILKAMLFSASAISVLSLAVTIVATTANFQDRYGSSGVAAVIVLGLWLFLANTVLLVGFRLALEESGRRRRR